MGLHVTVIALSGNHIPKSLRELIWQEYYIDAKANGMTEEEARAHADKALTPGHIDQPPTEEPTIETAE
jgi:hypothetical protein